MYQIKKDLDNEIYNVDVIKIFYEITKNMIIIIDRSLKKIKTKVFLFKK